MSDRVVLTDGEREQVLESLRKACSATVGDWESSVLGVSAKSTVEALMDAVVDAINEARKPLPRGTVKVGGGDVAVKDRAHVSKPWFVHGLDGSACRWVSDEHVSGWRVVYQPGEQQ